MFTRKVGAVAGGPLGSTKVRSAKEWHVAAIILVVILKQTINSQPKNMNRHA